MTPFFLWYNFYAPVSLIIMLQVQLLFSTVQLRDQRDQIWIIETKTENVQVDVKTETGKFIGCRDQNSSRLRNSLMSRPRLIETEKFLGCRDWKISWMSRLRLIETGKFNVCRYQDQSRLVKRCRYRDSIETLAYLWLDVWRTIQS